jgi:hypothetical protein
MRRGASRAALLLCLQVLASSAVHAEDYGFDVGQFEKKAFEWGGHGELKWEGLELNRDGAGYQLNFFNRSPRNRLDRLTATVELEGRWRQDPVSFNFRAHGAASRDALEDGDITRIYEGYLGFVPRTGLRFELGKRALRWGKGYAWSPVGFLERPKDPNDPDLSREGFVLGSAEWVGTGVGPFQTLSLNAYALPVGSDLNSDFGSPDELNGAFKAYALYRDTDIDFMYLGQGSRPARIGLDFSRNLRTNLEIHGEWAHVFDQPRSVLVDGTGRSEREVDDVDSYLFGLRYLTEGDTTWIVEYYRNGSGYTVDQMQTFYDLLDSGVTAYETSGDAALLNRARTAADSGYLKPNALRDYLYVRASKKEPFDILYFAPALTLIANLNDHSWTLTPELLYTRYTNLELRGRLTLLHGDEGTEFGEKQNDSKVELRIRYFF